MNDSQRGLFSFDDIRFTLYESPSRPQWRSPQRGALGALMAHWSLPRGTPALISLPTGSGKSAVALAAPFLASAQRVLVVVPSKDLRRQLAGAFTDLALLQRIDAVDRGCLPRVHELVHRVQDWQDIEQYEVVVASPSTISPVHYPESPPPAKTITISNAGPRWMITWVTHTSPKRRDSDIPVQLLASSRPTVPPPAWRHAGSQTAAAVTA